MVMLVVNRLISKSRNQWPLSETKPDVTDPGNEIKVVDYCYYFCRLVKNLFCTGCQIMQAKTHLHPPDYQIISEP